jgi:hypothetical protein
MPSSLFSHCCQVIRPILTHLSVPSLF